MSTNLPKIKQSKESILKRKLAWTPEMRKAAAKRMKGKSVSPKTQFKKGQNVGNKAPNWTGGSEAYNKRIAMARDKFMCQVCGLNDKEVLEVDHILAKAVKPELFNDINNMITLCANCHRRKTNKEMKDKLYYKGHKNKNI